MSEKIPPRFRKTKSDKWAVMAPIDDLEKALAEGGKIDVQKRSGDWSTFRVASLGKPFDVDGVQMCYGYGPDDGDSDAAQGGAGNNGGASADRSGSQQPRSSRPAGSPQGGPPRRKPSGSYNAPPVDPSEPLPEYQGSSEDEWDGGF